MHTVHHRNARRRGLTGRLNGRTIREARRARGLTLTETAHRVGLSPDRSGARTLSLIERDRAGTSIRTADRLCSLFGLRLELEFERMADSVWGTLHNARRCR
jgi:transcriptional regulator with XRE-family HTH domain